MFNDLNNPNSPSHAAVDDIFAETDKPANGNQAEIETHRVGLAANGENLPVMEAGNGMEYPKKNYLKIIIIVLGSLVFLGIVYFVYSQFFAKDNSNIVATSTPKTTVPLTDVTANTPTNSTPTTDNTFVAVIPASTTDITNGASSTEIIPGEVASSTSTSTLSTSTIDSDNDGLTDVEEKAAGTNPNVIDTDNDGLSDYEEVKIYHTNPLVADTDGDGYLDGAEVKSGYNPNGPGKLPGNVIKK